MIDVEANLASYRDADGNLPDRVLCPCGGGHLIFVWEWERWTGRPYNPQPLLPRAFWVKP